MSSSWRSTQVADEYLERYGVPVIAEVDTRAVVRHLRANGVMRGVIASGEEGLIAEELVERARAIQKMVGADLASAVSTKTCGIRGTRRSRATRQATALLGIRATRRHRRRCMWWHTTSASRRTSCAC